MMLLGMRSCEWAGIQRCPLSSLAVKAINQGKDRQLTTITSMWLLIAACLFLASPGEGLNTTTALPEDCNSRIASTLDCLSNLVSRIR